MSTSQLLVAWDKMEAAIRGWGKRAAISLTGGEPFIRKDDAILPLLARMKSGGIVDGVDILTNGSLLNDDLCRELADINIVRRIQVSLEGATPEDNDRIRGEGTFRRTIEAIERMKASGLKVAVMMTVSKCNKAHVSDVIELCSQQGVAAFALERFMPLGQGRVNGMEVLSAQEVKEVFSEVYNRSLTTTSPKILLHRPLCGLLAPNDPNVGAMCSVGINALTLMHDGTILPCRRLPMVLGNILTDNIHEIWFESPILWKARNPKNLKGKCSECHLVPICRGCRAMAFALTGNWLASDPHCWMQGNPKKTFSQPMLLPDARLVNPVGTDVYFAYHRETGTTLELDRTSHTFLASLDGDASPYLIAEKLGIADGMADSVIESAVRHGFVEEKNPER